MRHHRTRPVRLLAAIAAAGTLTLVGCTSATEQEDPGAQGQDPSAGAPDTPGEADPAGGGAAVSGAACLASVTWQGTLYVQVAAEPVEQGKALEGAEVPPCNDTAGTGGTGQEEQAQPVDAFAVQGVDPAYAVTSTSPGGQFVYVAEEYVPGRTDAEPLPEKVSRRLGLR